MSKSKFHSDGRSIYGGRRRDCQGPPRDALIRSLGAPCLGKPRCQIAITSQKMLWEHRSLRVSRIDNPRKPRKFAEFLPEPHARLFVIPGERLKQIYCPIPAFRFMTKPGRNSPRVALYSPFRIRRSLEIPMHGRVSPVSEMGLCKGQRRRSVHCSSPPSTDHHSRCHRWT